MTVSKTDTPAYTDINGLTGLKRQAGAHDPAAIRKVAQQFESMFTRMMLKSMRDASGKDPMFGSDQQDMYQSMADDQLAVELSKGKGLGLADMLIRQLQKDGVKGADQAAGKGAGATGTTTGTGTRSTFPLTTPGSAFGLQGLHTSHNVPARGAAAYSATQRSSSGTAQVSEADKANFVRSLWPHAAQAGQQLGVDPGHLIAQAALETNWGQSLPQDTAGHSSNNLFGIKASSAWGGATVNSNTVEYQGTTATSTSAQFRSYATAQQSFQDYVSLLRGNPRYSGALDTGSNVQAFAAGLQRGGYATDPDYAGKIAALVHKVNGTLASVGRETGLKLADAPPITATTGTL